MVNSIGGSSMVGMHRPDPQDFFKKVDSDSSGGISQTELKTLSDNLQKMTGKTLDASDEAFSSYDSNGDGSLSSDELKSVLDKSGFGPPSGAEGMVPPPPSQDQATASYAANSGDDSLSALITSLQSLLTNYLPKVRVVIQTMIQIQPITSVQPNPNGPTRRISSKKSIPMGAETFPNQN